MSKPLKRIYDHAERLTRLNVMDAERPIDDSQIDEELEKVCKQIWGYSPDDVHDSLMSAEDQKWFEDLWGEDEIVQFCEECGYDVRIPDTHLLLRDWGTFVWMMLAEKRGLLTPENKIASRLLFEAEEFAENKKAGVLRG